MPIHWPEILREEGRLDSGDEEQERQRVLRETSPEWRNAVAAGVEPRTPR